MSRLRVLVNRENLNYWSSFARKTDSRKMSHIRANHVQQALPKLGKPRREGTHRTVSTQPNHCFFTRSFSDGEKFLNHIQTSSSRSGQKFLPPTPKVPLGNVSG
ncbi:hypothetical protein AVEN_200727-1 [Araneus ventricosus]|uniref:Uncharacterized protein n=1 Tax=Araneus ventricosus TaxID=182803 RepID=A0A4Y2R332_ARAVE|nr:hypothetical protein AVEN_200727-1 [Araneus ventricosus]